MNKQTKKKLIENCGSLPVQTRNPRGAIVVVNYGRCNYYKDCPKCHVVEAEKRHRVYAGLLRSKDTVFCAIVPKEDTARLTKKLGREAINHIKIPQEDGTYLYVAEKDANHKEILFQESDASLVLQVLGTDAQLFPNGRRSTGGEWALSSSGEVQLKEEVQYEDLECFFVPNVNDSGSYERLKFLRSMANIWDGGKVTLDNVQHFVDVSVSAFAEFAQMNGYKFVPEKSRIVQRSVTAEQLEKWEVLNIDSDKMAISYPNAPKEQMEASYPEMVQFMSANTGIKNWRLSFIEWKQNEKENKKQNKQFWKRYKQEEQEFFDNVEEANRIAMQESAHES